MNLDLTTFTGITAATTGLVATFKHLWPAWVKGKEKSLSLLLPVAFVVVMKVTGGGFLMSSYLEAIVEAILCGMGAGVAHDKLLNAYKGNKK